MLNDPENEDDKKPLAKGKKVLAEETFAVLWFKQKVLTKTFFSRQIPIFLKHNFFTRNIQSNLKPFTKALISTLPI